MKVKVEDAGPCRKVLTITVPAESVTAEYKKITRDSVVSASMPGFRKGKAPEALVARRYAKEIENKVKEHLVSRSYRDALIQKQIDPIAVLEFKDVTLVRDQSLTYKVVLDVPPEFKLPKYKEIHVTENKIEVSNDDVQKHMEQLINRFAKYKKVKGRPVRKSDMVLIDYKGNCDGIPINDLEKDAPALGKGKNFWAVADENAFLPGFDTGLLGMKEGDEKEIQVNFQPDFRFAAVAGKKALYHVTLKEIREKQAQQMDKDFLKQFDVNSEEELMTKVRESLLAEEKRKEKQRLKKEIMDKLLSKISIDLPESLVQEESRHMFSSMVQETLQSGMTKEQIDVHKDDLLRAATKSASERVKLGYILHRIAEQEKITVDDEEVNHVIQQMAGKYHTAPDSLRKELEEKKEIDSIKRELRMDKTLDFLLKHAKISAKGLLSRIIGGRKAKVTATAKVV